jgi:hypothetical protein
MLDRLLRGLVVYSKIVCQPSRCGADDKSITARRIPGELSHCKSFMVDRADL